jgi:hypothetical protein
LVHRHYRLTAAIEAFSQKAPENPALFRRRGFSRDASPSKRKNIDRTR